MVVLFAGAFSSLGCWEQVSPEWFPQMKRQPSIQAFELVEWRDQLQGWTPPDGTVPVGMGSLPDDEVLQTALTKPTEAVFPNPVQADLSSLKRGEELYLRQCAVCHGSQGLGDGPVAGPPFGNGPFGLVLPVNGPISQVKNYSGSYLYAIISNGRGRMPNYRRITPEERWDVVNYLRELNRQGEGQ